MPELLNLILLIAMHLLFSSFVHSTTHPVNSLKMFFSLLSINKAETILKQSFLHT